MCGEKERSNIFQRGVGENAKEKRSGRRKGKKGEVIGE